MKEVTNVIQYLGGLKIKSMTFVYCKKHIALITLFQNLIEVGLVR